MNGGLRLPVNLATRPIRNRRLFRAVCGSLIGLFLLFGGGAGFLLVHSAARSRSDEKASAKLERLIQDADREHGEKAGQSAALKKKYAELVAGINDVIARKNFSWVDFFSRLESALPPHASIGSINSLELSGTSLRVTMKILSPGLPGLLNFVEKLAAEKFTDVTMRSETTGGGHLISEIGFVYDGSH